MADDDAPALSAETFAALQEFYAEQAKRQEIFDKLQAEDKLKENVLFDENWAGASSMAVNWSPVENMDTESSSYSEDRYLTSPDKPDELYNTPMPPNRETGFKTRNQKRREKYRVKRAKLSMGQPVNQNNMTLKRKASEFDEPSHIVKHPSQPITGKKMSLKRKASDFDEPSHIVKHPNLTSYDKEPHNTAQQSDLAVVIDRVDGKPVDKPLAAIIRNKLSKIMDKAVAENVDSSKLSFAASGLVSEGYFLVKPMTVEARDWLLSCKLGNHNGTQIRIRKLHKNKVTIWLPGKKAELPDDPLRLLKGQNKDKVHLKIFEWTLISKETFPTGERLILVVPDGTFENMNNVWLNFQLTQVQAKRIGSGPTTVKPSQTYSKITTKPVEWTSIHSSV